MKSLLDLVQRVGVPPAIYFSDSDLAKLAAGLSLGASDPLSLTGNITTSGSIQAGINRASGTTGAQFLAPIQTSANPATNIGYGFQTHPEAGMGLQGGDLTFQTASGSTNFFFVDPAGTPQTMNVGNILLYNGAVTEGVQLSAGNGWFSLSSGMQIQWTSGANYNDTKDVGLRRSAAGELAVTNATSTGTLGQFKAASIRGAAVAFASLPASPVEGMLVAITDSPTTTWGATISTGASSGHVLAYYDGTNWTVAAK